MVQVLERKRMEAEISNARKYYRSGSSAEDSDQAARFTASTIATLRFDRTRLLL